jgi:hypothetical protein
MRAPRDRRLPDADLVRRRAASPEQIREALALVEGGLSHRAAAARVGIHKGALRPARVAAALGAESLVMLEPATVRLRSLAFRYGASGPEFAALLGRVNDMRHDARVREGLSGGA